jgi:integrative and conjugative element protein (TIGR02256 family)
MPQLVVLSERAMVSVLAEVKEKIATETGGVFLGHRKGQVWYVVESIDPGPRSVFREAYFEYDRDYIIHLMNKVARLYREPLDVLGLWHRHPGSMDQFSSVDAGTNSEFAAMHAEGAISALVNLDPEFRITMYEVQLPLQYRKVQVLVGNEHFRDTRLLAYREQDVLRKEMGRPGASPSKQMTTGWGNSPGAQVAASGNVPAPYPAGRIQSYNPYAEPRRSDWTGASAGHRNETGSAPRVETGSAPRVETGSAPRVETGSAPRVETGSAPRVETRTTQSTSPSLDFTRPSAEQARDTAAEFTYGLDDLLRFGGTMLRYVGKAMDRPPNSELGETELEGVLDVLAKDLAFLERLGFVLTLQRTKDGCLNLVQRKGDSRRRVDVYFYRDGGQMFLEHLSRVYLYEPGLLERIHLFQKGGGKP